MTEQDFADIPPLEHPEDEGMISAAPLVVTSAQAMTVTDNHGHHSADKAANKNTSPEAILENLPHNIEAEQALLGALLTITLPMKMYLIFYVLTILVNAPTSKFMKPSHAS